MCRRVMAVAGVRAARVAVYAFRIALAGRPVLGGAFFNE